MTNVIMNRISTEHACGGIYTQVKRFVITITVLLTLLFSNLTQAQEVSIPDANLRTAVQQEIGNEITTDTILNLTRLDAIDLGITNLTGLEHAQNLNLLNLAFNSISDVSPLTGLTSLRQLDLLDNSISDVSPLAGLTQLTALGLGANSISDVSPLAGLTSLTSLHLLDNSISDVSSLTRLTQLTTLDLRQNPLNAAAINTHIPAIQANGTRVLFDNPAPTTPPAAQDEVPTFEETEPTLPIGASLTATSIPTPLTEAALHNSTVTLTLQGRTFENDINVIRGSVSVSGIFVILPADGFRRDSDTQISMRLAFNGDFDSDGILTFTVTPRGIKNYNGSDLTATLSVSANAESLTVTPTSLTEATLDGSLVRLTLRGRKFADNIGQYVTTPGLPGVRFSDINRVSDTEVTVRLAFNGNFDSDVTLTFWINQGGIPSYPYVLTAELPIIATVAPTPQPNVGTTPEPKAETQDEVQTFVEPEPTLSPDLVVSGLRASKATLAPGEGFTLFATVKNQGTGQAVPQQRCSSSAMLTLPLIQESAQAASVPSVGIASLR